MNDEEMGRQVLNGMSPIAFERCRALPEHCIITENDVKDLLPAGATLHSEINVSDGSDAANSAFRKL